MVSSRASLFFGWIQFLNHSVINHVIKGPLVHSQSSTLIGYTDSPTELSFFVSLPTLAFSMFSKYLQDDV